MAKRLGFIFLVIFALGFFNYVWTQLSNAFAANNRGAFIPLGAAPVGPIVGRSSSNSLSKVNFNLFTKGGSGWGYVTQGYGRTPYSAWYVGGWHNGIDVAAQYGASIYSPDDGTVLAVGNQDSYCPHRGFGKFVAVIDPANNIVLWYGHLGTVSVSAGQEIKKGAQLGTIGDTGFETGYHLHLSIFALSGFTMKNKNGCGLDADGRDMDPVPYLEQFAK